MSLRSKFQRIQTNIASSQGGPLLGGRPEPAAMHDTAVRGAPAPRLQRPRLAPRRLGEQSLLRRVLLLVAFAAHSVGLLRSEEHTSELQSRENLVCRLL